MQIMQTPFQSPLGHKAAALRVEVFVHEQHVPPEEELDHNDPIAIHFVALDDDAVIATLRIVRVDTSDGPAAKIGRVAVEKSHRNRGIGKSLMLAAIEHARALGISRCILGAQLQVLGFYEKLGFIAHGEVFSECNIPHRHMTLHLQNSSVRANKAEPAA